MTHHSLRGIVLAAGIGALTVGMSACGSSGSSSSATSSASTSSSSAAGGSASGKTVTFVEGRANDAYYGTEACGAKSVITAAGATFTATGPSTYDAAEQVSSVNDVVASAPSAMILSPVNPTSLVPPVESAVQRGIKVILVANTLSNASLASATVLANNEQGGELAAKAILAKGKPSGTVLILAVAPGNPAINARVSGFQKVMTAAGVTVLPTQYDNLSATTGSTDVTSTLAAHPDLAGVFATDDSGLLGAGKALRNAGKTGTIPLVGFDALPSEVALVKSGEVQALVAQPAKQEGAQAAQYALAVLEGKPVQKTTTLNDTLITQANVNSTTGAVYTGMC